MLSGCFQEVLEGVGHGFDGFWEVFGGLHAGLKGFSPRSRSLSTTVLPELDLEHADAPARTVGLAVAKAVQDIPSEPSEKLEVVEAAAQAAAEAALHSSTTTAFDGVRLVLDAAARAGVDGARLAKVRREAEMMTKEQQRAAQRSLEAAVGHSTPLDKAWERSKRPRRLAKSPKTERFDGF